MNILVLLELFSGKRFLPLTRLLGLTAMPQGKKRRHWDKFFLGIILPTILAVILSIGSIYLIILQDNKIDGAN